MVVIPETLHVTPETPQVVKPKTKVEMGTVSEHGMTMPQYLFDIK